MQEEMSLPPRAPAAAVVEEADTPSPDALEKAAASAEKTALDDTTAMSVMVGLNDALRAPLVAIRGRAELIEAGMLGQISEEQAQWLKAIQENTARSFRVLDAIQRLINVENKEIRINWSDFIASELLEEAHERVKDRAAAQQHSISIHLPDSVPLARGDFYQTLIILTDLLDNAIRYTPEGGQIRLSVDSLGTHVLFTVADTGIGLRPEDLEQVGKPFWRGDYHPRVRQYTGSGLTLFLAKQVLALQGGELIFSGEPELGSTFSFTLAAPSNVENSAET
jgi:signal transduction histidine kinase